MSSASNNIELPKDIVLAKPQRGFKTELVKFNNGDSYQGYFNEDNKREGYGIYIKKMVLYLKVYGKMIKLEIMEF